jgi:hypothetical protein
MKLVTKALLGAGVMGLAAGVIWQAVPTVEASDQGDPPMRVVTPGMDTAADIGDLYAWHSGTGADAKLTAIVTFDSKKAPAAGQKITCDGDVLYRIHLESGATTFAVEARLGEDDAGNCFVQIKNAPGAPASAVIEGPTGRPFTRKGVKVFAGLVDDPFFFDQVGYVQSLTDNQIRMTNDRDDFAGKNASAIAIEVPLSAVSSGGASIRVYATSARTGG